MFWKKHSLFMTFIASLPILVSPLMKTTCLDTWYVGGRTIPFCDRIEISNYMGSMLDTRELVSILLQGHHFGQDLILALCLNCKRTPVSFVCWFAADDLIHNLSLVFRNRNAFIL